MIILFVIYQSRTFYLHQAAADLSIVRPSTSQLLAQ